MLAGAMQENFIKTINEDLAGYLPHVKQPTLILWGQRDTETPLSDGRRMEKDLPDAKLVVMQGAGHFVYVDDFAGTKMAIDRFLV
jgi:pimeloyl-ACP methyl ester carboxylesterase